MRDLWLNVAVCVAILAALGMISQAAPVKRVVKALVGSVESTLTK